MHFSMASNYLRKSYKQRLPQTESLLNTANYIPVRQMVSSTFGTLVLSFFPQPSFSPFSLGLRCSLPPSLYIFSSRLPGDVYRRK